jgi:group I intron endonuclease
MIKCGIYKIVNPTGKIYIGQAIDIDKRWSEYNLNNSNLPKQPKIYRSLKKYGINNHLFEVIEECTIEQLNEREIYWGEHYGVLGENGLNLRLGGQKGKINEHTKLQISTSLIGKPKLTSKKGKEHALYGISKTEEHKNNIKKGKENISQDTLIRMSKAIKGKKKGKKSLGSGRKTGFKVSEETKQKMRLAKLGKPSNKN